MDCKCKNRDTFSDSIEVIWGKKQENTSIINRYLLLTKCKICEKETGVIITALDSPKK